MRRLNWNGTQLLRSVQVVVGSEARELPGAAGVEVIELPLFEFTQQALVPVPRTTFTGEQIKEREDLQRLLRHHIQAVADDVLVVAEEFGEFQDAHRRIDLLGVDRGGRLVVIELKRTQDGGHMELQALRYAAMVRTMTYQRLVEIFDAHLTTHPDDDSRDARERLDDWLDDAQEEVLATDVRIVLVSADFGREITGTVLWLNEYGLDIRCVRLVPYRVGDRVVLDVQQLIPLPEATDYQVKLRQKQALVKAGTSGADWTQYRVTDSEGVPSDPLRKRRAVLAMAQALTAAGVEPAELTAALPEARYKKIPHEYEGLPVEEAFEAAFPQLEKKRWFVDAPLVGSQGTFVLSKMWGLNTEPTLQALAAMAPSGQVTFERVE
jgi:hypothetical protein